MRLFVAIDIPDSLKEAIESELVPPIRHRLAGARVSWPRPEGRHFTLKFLGRSVPDDRVPEIVEVLMGVGLRHRSFEASVGDIGAFPKIQRPRVLWLGLADGAEEMVVLAQDIDSELGAIGFESEERPFHPHLTLVRFQRPSVRDVPEFPVPRQRFSVDEFILYQSQLHPKGARYTALQRFPLSA